MLLNVNSKPLVAEKIANRYASPMKHGVHWFRREHLKRLLLGFNSQREFADKCGLVAAHVSQMVTGKREVGSDVARRIEEHLELGWGTMDMPPEAEQPHTNRDFALVPLYDVRAAAGNGSVVTTERIVDTLAFRPDFLRHELSATPEDLYLIHVEGDSMDPTLRAGDVILVDHRRKTADREGIYVIRMEDALLVKRLHLLPGGKINATSDNAAYKTFEIDASTTGVAIIGRVVWAGRRF